MPEFRYPNTQEVETSNKSGDPAPTYITGSPEQRELWRFFVAGPVAFIFRALGSVFPDRSGPAAEGQAINYPNFESGKREYASVDETGQSNQSGLDQDVQVLPLPDSGVDSYDLENSDPPWRHQQFRDPVTGVPNYNMHQWLRTPDGTVSGGDSTAPDSSPSGNPGANIFTL